MIQTVNGPISVKELGVTMCHEHLAVDLSRVRKDQDSNFDDRELICDEIEKMKAFGVQSIIEVSCNDIWRDLKTLRWYSNTCGIHIVASTGYYLEEYHSDFVRNSSPEELSEVFCKEITVGIDGTDIKAGFFGEVASGEPVMTESERKVLIAAALAGKRTKTAVTTHCQLGRLGLEQCELFHKYGMDPAKVILGHVDLANDKAYYEELLKQGVNLGFDTIGKTGYLSDEDRADNLMWLIERGWMDRIVLSQDISTKSYLSSYAISAGDMTVMKNFLPML